MLLSCYLLLQKNTNDDYNDENQDENNDDDFQVGRVRFLHAFSLLQRGETKACGDARIVLTRTHQIVIIITIMMMMIIITIMMMIIVISITIIMIIMMTEWLKYDHIMFNRIW